MFTTPKIIEQGNNVHVQHGSDAGLYVEFHMQAVENKQRSIEEGRPIFEDKEYITIFMPGDNKTKRVRPVKLDWDAGTPPDPERWPRQWQAFKNQQQQVMEGTPLEEWGMITKSDALSMKAINIHTVEQLAGLQENHLTWLGARQMRDKASSWIEQSKGNAGISQLQAKYDALLNDFIALQNQVKSMNSLDEDKPRRGRPKKEVTDDENIS